MWRAANTAAGYKFLVTSTQPCFVAPCATAKDGGSAGFAGAKNLPTARDGGSAGFAGAKNLPTARMAEVPEMQEQCPGKAGVQILFGLPAAGRETSFGLDTGL
ncbi:MAG TPA: hypothetical protein VFM15_07415, partial [Gammaproteobacteria bacterium]|nr:hypothetical protein [Gammaproteobacteria bacterium]